MNPLKSSRLGGTSRRTYTASIWAASKAALWTTGLSEWETGQPMTP